MRHRGGIELAMTHPAQLNDQPSPEGHQVVRNFRTALRIVASERYAMCVSQAT